jgi:hypothetical protein
VSQSPNTPPTLATIAACRQEPHHAAAAALNAASIQSMDPAPKRARLGGSGGGGVAAGARVRVVFVNRTSGPLHLGVRDAGGAVRHDIVSGRSSGVVFSLAARKAGIRGLVRHVPQVRPVAVLEAGQEHSVSGGDRAAWVALGPGGAAGLGIQQTLRLDARLGPAQVQAASRPHRAVRGTASRADNYSGHYNYRPEPSDNYSGHYNYGPASHPDNPMAPPSARES